VKLKSGAGVDKNRVERMIKITASKWVISGWPF
jgi:hypothetical protein